MKITITEKKEYDARYIKASCGVRYWEDATVNGIEDTEGNLIPDRLGDLWNPLIDIDEKRILNWPVGTTADIHYKVCDNGEYTLLDDELNIIKKIEGYVPNIMCHGDSGYGDYVIMNVDENGFISEFRADLSDFEDSDNY